MDSRTSSNPLSELKRMAMFGLLNAAPSLTSLPVADMQKRATPAEWMSFAVQRSIASMASPAKEKYIRAMAFRYLADCWAEGKDASLGLRFNSALREFSPTIRDTAITGLAQSGKIKDRTLSQRLAHASDTEQAAAKNICQRLDELIVDGSPHLIPAMKTIRSALYQEEAVETPKRPKPDIGRNYELPFGPPVK